MTKRTWSKLTLVHWSARVLRKVQHTPLPMMAAEYHKPRGLWVSVVEPHGEDGWYSYCQSYLSGRSPQDFRYCNRVWLKPSAKIIHLQTPAEIKAFSREFFPGREGCVYVPWQQVAARFQGIIIAPYHDSLEEDDEVPWYARPWSCASGCIWDAAAVRKVELVFPERASA